MGWNGIVSLRIASRSSIVNGGRFPVSYSGVLAAIPPPLLALYLFYNSIFSKKNQSTPRPYEHPPVMGGKMSNV